MTTDLRVRAAAYLALAEMATPGPWEPLSRRQQTGWEDATVRATYRQEGAQITCFPAVFESPTEPNHNNAHFVAASHEAAQLIRDFLNALPETTGATAGNAPTAQISPPAVDAVAAPMTPSAVAGDESSDHRRAQTALGLLCVLGCKRDTETAPVIDWLKSMAASAAAPQAAPDSATPSAEPPQSEQAAFVKACQRLNLDPDVEDLRSLWNFAKAHPAAPQADGLREADEQRLQKVIEEMSDAASRRIKIPANAALTIWENSALDWASRLRSLAAAHPAPHRKDEASSVRGIRSASSPVVGEES